MVIVTVFDDRKSDCSNESDELAKDSAARTVTRVSR